MGFALWRVRLTLLLSPGNPTLAQRAYETVQFSRLFVGGLHRLFAAHGKHGPWGNIQQPTSNIEHPMASVWEIFGCWVCFMERARVPLAKGVVTHGHGVDGDR